MGQALTGRAPLRVAVIGAGAMGANHARVINQLKGVELAAIVDASADRGRALAETYGCTYAPSIDGLIGTVDAATVATSSTAHAAVAVPLLAAGIPCLVEKPLAMDEAECQAIIAAAAKGGVAVGHVERFNPAIAKTAEILRGQTIHAIDGRRLNPGSARILDTDVVVDLMVHDIDVALHLMGGAPTGIVARGIALGKQGVADHATALMSFPGGAVTSLTASRITQNKVRELQILCDPGMVTVNYITQELHITRSRGYDRGPGEWPTAPTSALDLVIEKIFIRQSEPLAMELGTFFNAVRDGRMDAGVSAADALEALRAAWAIQADLASGWADQDRDWT